MGSWPERSTGTGSLNTSKRVSTTCGGTVTAKTGDWKVSLAGGSIPANGSCAVKVDVTAKYKGSYYNKLYEGALRTNNGSNATPAVATLTVKADKAHRWYGWW